MAAGNGDVADDELVLPDIERAIVYTPEPGDVVVIEVENMRVEQVDTLRDRAREVFGTDVKIVVLSDAHFAGVVRP